MAAPDTVQDARVPTVKEFVTALSRRSSDDIEKLLVHLLDVAANHWNEQATQHLTTLKRSDISTDEAQRVKRLYDEAFNNSRRILKMRHGCSISKRRL